jgi:hypothetical protein
MDSEETKGTNLQHLNRSMKKLLATAVLATLALPSPAQATSHKDSYRLADLIKSTGTTIAIEHCRNSEAGNYSYSREQKIDRLTICENNVDMSDADALWEVMAHESTHVMQACMGGHVLKDEYLPRMYRDLKTQAPHYSKIITGYPSTHQLVEAEAFWMELQEPDFVTGLFKLACKKQIR